MSDISQPDFEHNFIQVSDTSVSSTPRSSSTFSEEESMASGVIVSSLTSSLDPSVTNEISKDVLQVSTHEREIVLWMRAHPNKSFVVDDDYKISALCKSLSLPSQKTAHDEYERVDLTNEPVPIGRSSKGIMISPGAFTAVSGRQKIFYERKGDRKHVQKTANPRDRLRHPETRGSTEISESRVKLRSPQSSMSVAGASVLFGASNFVIKGGSIAAGAFSAIAGDQEI
ncbi:hypothetical protein J3R30DRAFT_3800465 [Lentinula aciculospora]|uniref:Uncharacterized protein n=1 Tax=Lentinula aciculospora TaxID=153920 RepID=A0A9W9DHX2_9AGAR|nr:hypothetical protein J3R30DRAFT_3800465 [Lentinula aciculospora]